MQNRSVPANVILPHVVYSDVASAIRWLVRVFGFKEHYRYGPPDSPQGGQIFLGPAFVQLASSREGRGSPTHVGSATAYVTVFVGDVSAHYEDTKVAGGKIVEELNETMYGELQYVAEDLEGHRWLFSQHVRDVAPEEWGAIVTNRPT